MVWYHKLGTEKNEKTKVAFQQRKDSKELTKNEIWYLRSVANENCKREICPIDPGCPSNPHASMFVTVVVSSLLRIHAPFPGVCFKYLSCSYFAL